MLHDTDATSAVAAHPVMKHLHDDLELDPILTTRRPVAGHRPRRGRGRGRGGSGAEDGLARLGQVGGQGVVEFGAAETALFDE